MLSWCGAGGSAGLGRLLILLLLDDDLTVPGASSESALDQQLMQLNQRRYSDAGRAEGHSRAGDRIEHPCRYNDDHPGRYLDVNDLAAGAPLNILTAKATPTKCMPAIMDLDLLPDMGRMTARLHSTVKMLSSPVTTSALPTGPASPRSSSPESLMASTRKPG